MVQLCGGTVRGSAGAGPGSGASAPARPVACPPEAPGRAPAGGARGTRRGGAGAEADEALVQAVVVPAVGGEPGRGRWEGGADLVIAALAELLEAAEALLVAVVAAGHAADAHQHRHRVAEVPVVGELGGEPGHVVVADEGLRQLAVEERVVPPEGVVEFEEVAVVEGGPDRLPNLVMGDRGQH